MRTFLLTATLVACTAIHGQRDDARWTRSLLSDRAFIENKGQFDGLDGKPINGITHVVEEPGTRFLFTPDGLTIRLERKEKNYYRQRGQRHKPRTITYTDLVHMVWEGANPHARLEAEGLTPDHHTYARFDAQGSPADIEGVRSHRKLTYRDLYPGIDVEYTVHPQEGIKYALIVRPGADLAQVRMRYDNGRKLRIDPQGKLLIETAFGDITDHAPVSHYAGDGRAIIPSRFVLHGQVVGFELGAHDPSRAVVIDPWTVSPPSPNSNRIWDIEVDNNSNVYIYGGDSPLRLRKYDVNGNLLWTYVTTWDTANYWLGSLVTHPSGYSIITAGTEPRIARISTAGTLVWSANGGALDEYWRMAFNCDHTRLMLGGTRLVMGPNLFPIGYGRAFEIDLNTGAVLAGVNVAALSPGFLIDNPNEIRALCASPNNRFYFMTLDTIGTVTMNMNLGYRTNHSYAFSYQVAGYGPTNMGINGMAATLCHIFTTNGSVLHKRDITNGAIVGTANIPGGVTQSSLGANSALNGGVALDSCGHVYVGSGNAVHKYDQNLVLLQSVATPGPVYDVAVNHNGEVVACGQGFAAAYTMNACPLPEVACVQVLELTDPGPLCITDPPLNLIASIPGGTWSGPGITNPVAGTFNPALAGAGNHVVSYTLPNPPPCSDPSGAQSMTINVSPCTALNVCSENNGNLTVSNGVGPYTWQYQTTAQDCSACLIGCLFPPGCAVNVNTWTTWASGTTVAPPPNYPILITDGAGTTLQINSAAQVQPCNPCPSIAVSITFQANVTCYNGSDGAATLSASGGSAPYSYSWAPGGMTGPAQTGLSAGNYTVTITDGAGCTTTTVVTIGQPPPFTVQIIFSMDANCGANDGLAMAMAMGGAWPYTWQWSPSGGTEDTAYDLAPGDYTVTATDDLGCTASADVTILAIGGPTLNNIAVTPSACGTPTGTITISATGATQYSINGGATWQASNVFTGLAANTYNVAVSDGSGCQVNGTATIVNPSGPAITNVATLPSECGLATGTITITATGPGLTYSINGGLTFQGSNSFAGVAANTYNVVVADASGCTSFAQAVVSELSGPAVTNVAVTPSGCTVASGTITVTASGSGLQYSIDGGVTYQASNVFSGLAAGPYTITVANAGGCTGQATANIVTAAGPAITNVSSTPTGCAGPTGTITVTATGSGLQYSINGGATYQAANTFTGLSAGAYVVTVADGNGCTTQAPANIIVASGPVITNVATTPSACGAATGTVTVTAAGTGLQYSLDGGLTYQASSTFTGLGAALYDVVVIDANGCTFSEQASVASLAGPTIDQVVTVAPDCGLSNGSITVVATGSGLTYSIDGGTTFQASGVFGGLPAGTYNVVVADPGCSATAGVVLADGPGPAITSIVPVSPLCNGDPNGSITVNASGNAPFQYSIDGGATFVSGPVFGGLPAGTYDVVLSDAGGCTAAQTFVLAEPAALSLSITTTDPGCFGECTGSAVAVVTGGSPGTGFQYSWPGGTTGAAQATGLCAGAYSATVTDANGCTATEPFLLTDPEPFVVQNVLITDETCPGECNGTALVEAVNGASYSIDGGPAQTSPYFPGLCPGQHALSATSTNGCVTATVATVMPGLPVQAAFTVSPTVTSTVDPRFVFTNQSTGASYYFWNFGVHGSSTDTDPVLYTAAEATEFLACLIATSTAGCSDTACTRLVVRLDPTIHVPNAFTAGGDGQNDLFFVVGDPALNAHFRLYIFNRWGEEVFYSEDITKGWDGTYNGQPCQQGVYAWRVEVRDPYTAETRAYMGHVTLLR